MLWVMNTGHLILSIFYILEKWSYLNLDFIDKSSSNKQFIEAIGPSRTTAATLYNIALQIVGYDPRLKPHKIILFNGLFSQAMTNYKSFTIVYYPIIETRDYP